MTEERAAPERWKAEWADLFNEVVTSGLCTGCAACIVACPHDVLGYDTDAGAYKPFHLEDELGPGGCTHGLKGCTSCTRACPRFRRWETEADTLLFGRVRLPEEQSGMSRSVLLARATDPELLAAGQDGGVVSAILTWCLEHDRIDAALVSMLENDGSGWRAVPGVARNRAEVLAAAGSRYTYSANTLGYAQAVAGGAERLALVGMGCQASAPVVMRARKAGKVGRRLALSIGLMCSKTFDDAIFEEFFEARYGLARADISKINIKGVFQIWCRDGSYHEVPLKEGHAWTRQGCLSCPDFAAEHADISTGGIGELKDWTLTVVRSELGQEVIDGMIADGALETRPGDDDPGALALMRRLSTASRRRWPGSGEPTPRLGVPPPKQPSLAPAVPDSEAAVKSSPTGATSGT
ncbi:MAG TPA: Coenzyme F420 hydrogenase/dehydrogenase, beta subunit C-terminal domain [Acidimicrobiales bacterium]|nr:Coenzyme F420 hydrogenase/dehydrogenase, beta subunit C-terminal domain [Acidimicrobiales bacterium]